VTETAQTETSCSVITEYSDLQRSIPIYNGVFRFTTEYSDFITEYCDLLRSIPDQLPWSVPISLFPSLAHQQNLISYPSTDRPCNDDDRTTFEVRWHVGGVAPDVLPDSSCALEKI